MNDVRLLHISDTHFGAHDERKYSAVVAFARWWEPNIVVLTGDILDSPLRFRNGLDRANAFRNELSIICKSHIYCIPGNHDALLGQTLLKRFWRKFQPMNNTSYVTTIKVNDYVVCLICVDTTCWHLPHLNNSGIYRCEIEAELETSINMLLNRSDIDRERLITIALTHHHPIPTITAQAESMLYFKNSGQFLRFVSMQRARLILHGHQHDPHFTKIGFGTDQDNEMIGILSAGSCIKKQDHAGCGHFYTVRINQERALVTSYYYYDTSQRFVARKNFSVYRIESSEPKLVIRKQKFTITKDGDMIAEETRVYKRTKDGTSKIALTVGVDDQSPECRTNDLGLTVGGDACKFTWLEEKPRTKIFEVPIGDGGRGSRFEVAFTYRWPGGFRPLIQQGVDSGEFEVAGKLEWCEIRLVLQEASLQLTPIEVYCDGKVKRSDNNGAEQHVIIYDPGGLISWSVKTVTALPVTLANRRH